VTQLINGNNTKSHRTMRTPTVSDLNIKINENTMAKELTNLSKKCHFVT